jgi:hypothetical protein
MKKISLALIILLVSQVSFAACLQRDNSPVPFPLNVKIFQKFEKNWLFTQKREVSIRLIRTQINSYNYFLVNHMTEKSSRGHLIQINEKLCDIKSSTPFCLYNDKENLRMSFEFGLTCKDSILSILGFTDR